MKRSMMWILAGLAAIALGLAGCGLVSGTLFVSQEVDGNITAQTGASLDDSFGGVVVDFGDNDDLDQVDLDGIETMCIRLTAQNFLSTPVSGEVWVTLDTTRAGQTPQSVRQNGFRIFHGVALAPNETRLFTCTETLELVENLDRLVDAVQAKRFAVWGMGNQDVYHLEYRGIVFGMHVTGSL